MTEYRQIPLPICTCGQLLNPEYNPVENPWPRGRDSTFEAKDKSLALRDPLVDALVHSVELLKAKMEALEHQIATIVDVFNSPLPPELLVHRVRQLREEL